MRKFATGFIHWDISRTRTPLLRLLLCTLILIGAGSGITSVQAEAAPLRIATVDINAILNGLEESKSARSNLDKTTAKAKKEIDARRAALTKKEQQLRDNKVDPASAEGTQFRKQVKEFERYVRDTEEELKRNFLTMNNKLAAKVMKALNQFAEDKKYDLVLEKNKNGRSAVLYGAPAADITEEILSQLNE